MPCPLISSLSLQDGETLLIIPLLWSLDLWVISPPWTLAQAVRFASFLPTGPSVFHKNLNCFRKASQVVHCRPKHVQLKRAIIYTVFASLLVSSFRIVSFGGNKLTL